MSKALCRVTSKVFSIYTSSMWRSTLAAASWVLRGSSEWGGNGVWHVDSGVNPPGLFKRLLLEFNHPAILDTLWSWEGWLMSMQHINCKHQLIQKLQSTLWMDECNPMMRKLNKLWKKLCYTLLSTFHASYFIQNWLSPVWTIVFLKALDYTWKWYLNSPIFRLVIFYYLKYLKAFASVFSITQQTRLLVFIMHSLFLDKGPILLSAKAKGRAPVNCFKEICIILSDFVSILSWIFSRHGCLSYQRKEKRTSVERNGLSKEGTELSC